MAYNKQQTTDRVGQTKWGKADNKQQTQQNEGTKIQTTQTTTRKATTRTHHQTDRAHCCVQKLRTETTNESEKRERKKDNKRSKHKQHNTGNSFWMLLFARSMERGVREREK